MSAMDGDLRLLEALLFAAAEPVDEAAMAARLPEGTDLPPANVGRCGRG